MSKKEQDNRTYFTLKNGLRVVHVATSRQIEYCGVAVNAGSRDETPDRYGLAHFVEHTIFKGTQRRKAWHIINRMEAVGGELNAYTTKEETTIYTVFPSGNVVRGVELIVDLITGSIFPQAELDKEREVVADEINSYLDQPSEAIFDEYDESMFAGSPMAHNILGSEESVNRFNSEDCKEWLKRFYRTGNMVFFYTGRETPQRLERVLNRYADRIAEGEAERYFVRQKPEIVDVFGKTININSHQAHAIAGARIPGMYDADRHAYALLGNILGGPGMNSRLNVALRERRGLVYNVEASAQTLTDCGSMTIYYGCDPEDVGRCMRLVDREIRAMADNAMSERELHQAKKQYLGQLILAGDSSEQVALSTARTTLYFGRVLSDSEVRERIESVDSKRIQSAAQSLLPLSTLVMV